MHVLFKKKYINAFFQDNSRDQLDISTTQLNSHIPDNSHDTL